MSVTLYGHFSDFLSFANVSRAVARSLKRGNLQFSVHEIGSPNPTYLDCESFQVGCDGYAPVGICVGYPLQGAGWLAGHEFAVLVTACEADIIPATWARACNSLDLIVVPSQFCKAAFERSGVTTEIIVVHHGVDERYSTPQGLSSQGDRIELLHVSGAASFPQRKGTPQLLMAFRQLAAENPYVNLSLRLADQKAGRAAIKALDLEHRIFIVTSKHDSFAPRDIPGLMVCFDGVIQPSRGEGFGIVPLEARCNGVPVIMTTVTGHAEHYVEGLDTAVCAGPPGPLVTQGNDVGHCPTVEPDAIYGAMKTFLAHRDARRIQAQAWAKSPAAVAWRWPNVLKKLVERIIPLARKQRAVHAGEENSVRGF